jgi:hypothetical protein
MSYSSTIIDPFTKEISVLVSATYEEHLTMMLGALETMNYVRKQALRKFAITCAPIVATVGVLLLLAPLVIIVYLLIISIYFAAAPAQINPVKEAKQACVYARTYKNEIDRSVWAADAQILTPER